jgi:DNA repair ATPase RecN
LTGAVNDLATAVGATPLGAAGKVVELVGAKIIEMRAAGDIRKAVVKASEAVDIMAPVLSANFADLRKIHDAAYAEWESAAGAPTSVLRNYQASLQMEEQRLEYVSTLIIDYQSAPARQRWRAAVARAQKDEASAKKLEAAVPQLRQDLLRTLREVDTAFESIGGETDAPKIEKRQKEVLDLLNAHRKELTTLDPNYQRATTELSSIRDARATGNRVLDKAGEAITAWQKAHRSLQATATGQQTRPSVSDLLSIAKEIEALLQ